MAEWEELIKNHGPAAYLAAWRVLGQRQDAEDAIQAALLSAWRMHQTQAVRNWPGLLRHLSICRALDLLRSRRPTEELCEQPISSDPSSSLIAEANELVDRLRSMIATLPPREAEVFGLHFFADLEGNEIAELLGISTGAVATSLHKAKSKLRSQLSDLEARNVK